MAEFTRLSKRAMTFDDRKSVHAITMAPEKEFSMNLKRAMTFNEKYSASASVRRERSQSFSLPDVMYRKHFGMQDEDVKPQPFSMMMQEGIEPQEWAEPVVQVPLEDNSNKAIVVVDTFTTGAMLANQLYKMGYKIICVLSADLKDLLKMVPEGLEVSFVATIMFDTGIDEDVAFQSVMDQISKVNIPITAVLAGAETGVELADQLSEAMGLRTNGTALSEARRNKYVMGETVRKAGLRAVKQLRATVWRDIEEWLEDWQPNPFKVIVKPMDSAGSDDVTLCRSMDDVKNAFGNIMGKINGLGIVNKAVLVQEYLEGQEYVIDMVSRDGEHKVAGIWLYDRRAANGAGFVLFGQKMLEADAEHVREIIEYQKKVVDALGIRNGPTHGEVKWCKGEPVLVEVGARCHGGDGLWVKLASEAFGYNQVQCTIEAYLYPERFALIPAEPAVRLAHACIKWCVNYTDGIFQHVDTANMADVTAHSAYRGHQIFHHQGKKVVKTQTCFSWAGSILIADTSEEVMTSLYASIEQMEIDGMFVVEPSAQAVLIEARRPAVVITDPFSTGAVLAADLSSQGYEVVALYSEQLEHMENLQSLVPAGLTLSFAAVLPFQKDLAKLIASVENLLGLEVVQVLAGAETGVELADQLSEAMGLRTNGTALSEARRNKYVMGETVRKAGLRAVKQVLASEWAVVEAFLSEWPSPFKAIVKPMDSAGSDGVTLCLSKEDVEVAFHLLIGKINGLGMVNSSILVQEYLEGQEYVIDMVSRDGEHKVAGIWLYDRRPVNGAGFVCFGQQLLLVDAENVREIIEYQKKVVDALGIRNGPTHGEVKWFRGEPVLVEVGARCHGAEGVWQVIAEAVYGYNQVQCAIDAYFNAAKFAAMPKEPTMRICDGRLVFIVLHSGGVVKDFDQQLLGEIEAMPSFVAMELFAHKGQTVHPTVDCFTFGGIVKLIHSDEKQVTMDYNRIREIEQIGIIEYEEEKV